MPARRRRAVGPAGALPAGEQPHVPVLPAGLPASEGEPAPDDDERLRADRPPHHDRGV